MSRPKYRVSQQEDIEDRRIENEPDPEPDPPAPDPPSDDD